MQVTVAEVVLDTRDGVWVIVAEAIVVKELARVVEDTILRDVILSCRLASRCFSSEFYQKGVCLTLRNYVRECFRAFNCRF